jgi:hypothetical protein
MNRLKNGLKTAKNVAGLAVWTFTVLSITAEIHNSISTHAKHEDHNPCACGTRCIGCLFED